MFVCIVGWMEFRREKHALFWPCSDETNRFIGHNCLSIWGQGLWQRRWSHSLGACTPLGAWDWVLPSSAPVQLLADAHTGVKQMKARYSGCCHVRDLNGIPRAQLWSGPAPDCWGQLESDLVGDRYLERENILSLK